MESEKISRVTDRIKEENKKLNAFITIADNVFADERYKDGDLFGKDYDKAIELYPKFTDAWVRKGITLFNDKNYYEAEVCLNEAVRLSPSSFKAIYNRGKIRLALDNIDGALGDLDRAISLKPEHPKAHELFGDALMRYGKEDEAALHWALAERLKDKKKK